MKLTELITPASIVVPMVSKDKNAAISELVQHLSGSDRLSDPKQLLDAVFEREAKRSTGIGNGIAIPHGKSPACKDLVIAIGKPAEPVQFDAIDKKPVWLIVLFGSAPEQVGVHIQVLASISRIMNIEKNRAAFRTASNAQSLYDALLEADKTP